MKILERARELAALAEKATRGPWRVGKCYGAVVADYPIGDVRGADDDNAVADYGGHLVGESISSKNCPLIAAAPEMAELLGKLADKLEEGIKEIPNACPPPLSQTPPWCPRTDDMHGNCRKCWQEWLER